MQVRPFSPKREKYVGNDFQLFPASLSCVDERRFPLVLNGVGERGGHSGTPFAGSCMCVTEPHVSWVKIAQSVVPAMFRCRLVFF